MTSSDDRGWWAADRLFRMVFDTLDSGESDDEDRVIPDIVCQINYYLAVRDFVIGY